MNRLFVKLLLLSLSFDFIPAQYNETATVAYLQNYRDLYKEMRLEGLVNYKAFAAAMKGYDHIDVPNKSVLSLIDFTLPSNKERYFLFDMEDKCIIITSLVSHGRRSGNELVPNFFSNKEGSYKSSLGFYLTAEAYDGINGYSLSVDGLEEEFNSNARSRDIVIHGAHYASYHYMWKHNGKLGRSLGCPAFPYELNDTIIDYIKDGTILFIYSDNQYYLSKSKILQAK